MCIYNICVCSQIICPLDGRTWAIAESIEAGELEAVSSLYPLPPTVVSQHAQPPRRLILLTTQVHIVHSTESDNVWLSLCLALEPPQSSEPFLLVAY